MLRIDRAGRGVDDDRDAAAALSSSNATRLPSWLIEGSSVPPRLIDAPPISVAMMSPLL